MRKLGYLPILLFILLQKTNGYGVKNSNYDWNNFIQYFNHSGTLFDTIPTTTDGREFIFPLNFDNDNEILLLNFMNYMLSKLQSQNEPVDWDFGAHFAGGETSYFDRNDKKMFNFVLEDNDRKKAFVIVNNLGISYLWDGDVDACRFIDSKQKESKFIDISYTGSSSYETPRCTFNAAKEYCHRHGAELMLPDLYFWSYIYNPLCGSNDDQRHKSKHDANIFKSGFRNDDKEEFYHWIDFQYTTEDDDKINAITSAKAHFLNTYSSDNTYLGNLNDHTVLGAGNVYEYLIADDTIQNGNEKNTNNAIYISASELANEDYHLRLGKLSEYLATGFDSKKRSTVSASALNSKFYFTNDTEDYIGGPNFLLHYLSKELINNPPEFKKGGGGSNDDKTVDNDQCYVMKCENSNDGPILQQTSCNEPIIGASPSEKEIRPLCINKDFVSLAVVCPNDLKIEPGGHCGDNVHKILVKTVWGYFNPEIAKNSWGSEHGNVDEDETRNENIILLIQEIFETILVKNKIPIEKADEFLASEAKKPIKMFINCMGYYNQTLNIWQYPLGCCKSIQIYRIAPVS